MEPTENQKEPLVIRAERKGVEDGKNVYELTGTMDTTMFFKDKFKLIKALIFQASVMLSNSIAYEIEHGRREDMEKFVSEGKEELSLAMNSLLNMTFNL